MLNFLLFIILFFVILAVVVFATAAHFVMKGFRLFRNAAKGGGGRSYSHDRRYGSGPQGRTDTGSGNGTQPGEAVTDLRDRSVADRKIFSHDEGEYVDFQEISDK